MIKHKETEQIKDIKGSFSSFRMVMRLKYEHDSSRKRGKFIFYSLVWNAFESSSNDLNFYFNFFEFDLWNRNNFMIQLDRKREMFFFFLINLSLWHFNPWKLWDEITFVGETKQSLNLLICKRNEEKSRNAKLYRRA